MKWKGWKMRALILADIHSNYPALSAVLEATSDVDAVFCLGDLVLFGPNPADCMNLIRSRADRVVQGNHDEEIVRFCRQQAGQEPRNTNADRWKKWTADQLQEDHIDYLAGLPEQIETILDGHQVCLRHDLPLPGPEIMPDAPEELIKSRLDAVEFDDLLVGHSHIPYVRELGARRLFDVGSVGQPEHGDSRASYAVWCDGKITFHKTTYDVERAIADLSELPLDRPYIELWSMFWRHGYVDRRALAAQETRQEGN